MRSFVKGLIPCRDHLGNKWWFCETGNTRLAKKILSDKDREAFLDKDFIVFEYTDLTQEQEEDLFARVQMGVQLTLAEKMRASSGPWQEFAKLFEEDFKSLLDILKDKTRGAAGFRIILSCFSQILEVQHPTNSNGIPKLATTHTSLPKLLANHNALDDATKSHFLSVFNTFDALVKKDPGVFIPGQRSIKGPKTFSPVEFLAVASLISMYGDTRNHDLLLGDIWEMRLFIRKHHDELQINRYLWTTIWQFIEQLEAFRGTVDGITVPKRPALSSSSAQKPSVTSSSSRKPSTTSSPELGIVPRRRGRPSIKDKLKKLDRSQPGSIATSNLSAARTQQPDSSSSAYSSVPRDSRALFDVSLPPFPDHQALNGPGTQTTAPSGANVLSSRSPGTPSIQSSLKAPVANMGSESATAHAVHQETAQMHRLAQTKAPTMATLADFNVTDSAKVGQIPSSSPLVYRSHATTSEARKASAASPLPSSNVRIQSSGQRPNIRPFKLPKPSASVATGFLDINTSESRRSSTVPHLQNFNSRTQRNGHRPNVNIPKPANPSAPSPAPLVLSSVREMVNTPATASRLSPVLRGPLVPHPSELPDNGLPTPWLPSAFRRPALIRSASPSPEPSTSDPELERQKLLKVLKNASGHASGMTPAKRKANSELTKDVGVGKTSPKSSRLAVRSAKAAFD